MASPRFLPFFVAVSVFATACVADQQAARLTIAVRFEGALTSSELRPEIEAALHSAAVESGETVVVDDQAEGDRVLRLGFAQQGDRDNAPVEHWGAFAGFWSGVDNVTLSRLKDTPGGVYVPEGQGDPLASRLGIEIAGHLPQEDLVELLSSRPDAVALLPLSRADPRLRSLTVDGVNLLQGEQGGPEGLLAERVGLNWDDASLDRYAALLVERLTARAPAVVRLMATGDVILARCVYQRQAARGDFTHAFAATADLLRAADLTLASLDSSLSEGGEPIGCEETYNLLAPPRSVEGLAHAGIDVVSVATNHIKDCGTTGYCGNLAFTDTLDNLVAAGIDYAGGGRNLEEAHRPVIKTIKGVRFAILAYDDISSSFNGAEANLPGTAALTADNLRRDIAAAKLQAEVVIVMPHWGNEYQVSPTERQQSLAAVAAEAGATLVIGNHPHVPQAVQWHDNGAFTAYALGNFIFDQDWSLETQQGYVVSASFVGSRLAEVRLIPTRVIDMHQATFASPDEAESILRRIESASEELQ